MEDAGASSFIAATLRPEALARLAAVIGELLEHRDLALALDPDGMSLGQRLDQALDPLADLQREVGCRGPGELADVVDRRLAAGREAAGFSYSLKAFSGWSVSSARLRRRVAARSAR